MVKSLKCVTCGYEAETNEELEEHVAREQETASDPEPPVKAHNENHPFRKRFFDLETHVDELTTQTLVRLELLEEAVDKMEVRVAECFNENRGIRASMQTGDYKALRAELARYSRELRMHRTEEHR